MDDKIISNNSRGATARSKLKALGSPKAIQQQNLLTVLLWLYRWGFSTGDIISNLLGRKNRSHARRLAKDGWIQPVSIKGYPTYYVLTERGLAEAIRHSVLLFEYREADPYRVHLPTLHHDLTAQAETVTALQTGRIVDYVTIRMRDPNDDLTPIKVPDVTWIVQFPFDDSHINLPVGVEVELTPKWSYHLDQFVTSITDDLEGNRLNWVLILSDSKAILERYRQAFKPDRQVKIWGKSKTSQPVDTGKTVVLPAWTAKHVLFRQLGSTEPYPVFEY